MQSVSSKYVQREFHWRTWNCWELCRTVWRDLTGTELPYETPETITAGRIILAVRAALADSVASGRLSEGVLASPCLVLMESRLLPPHGGVMVDNLLLHVTPFDHTRHEPLDDVIKRGQFTQVRFFK